MAEEAKYNHGFEAERRGYNREEVDRYIADILRERDDLQAEVARAQDEAAGLRVAVHDLECVQARHERTEQDLECQPAAAALDADEIRNMIREVIAEMPGASVPQTDGTEIVALAPTGESHERGMVLRCMEAAVCRARERESEADEYAERLMCEAADRLDAVHACIMRCLDGIGQLREAEDEVRSAAADIKAMIEECRSRAASEKDEA